MNLPVKTAFKEWAVVVDALGRGDQCLILRKGGISEGKGGFQVDHQEFWLFPTLYHQQAESVVAAGPHGHPLLDTLRKDPATLPIQFLARVHSWTRIQSLEIALGLRGHHIWKDEVIADRFDWGRDSSIVALLLRLYRLPSPVLLPMQESYGGCKSWIQLEVDVDTQNAIPVLSDADFDARLKAIHKSLGESASTQTAR